jgi:TonB family protein
VVSVDVDANRRLSSPRLLRSTGSVEADRAVLKAVRGLKLPEAPPLELINRRVVLSVQAPVADTVVAGAAPVSP